jgi:hypothetical protein
VSARAARGIMGRDGDLVTGWYEEAKMRTRERKAKEKRRKRSQNWWRV